MMLYNELVQQQKQYKSRFFLLQMNVYFIFPRKFQNYSWFQESTFTTQNFHFIIKKLMQHILLIQS